VRLIMTAQGRGRTLYPQTEYWESQPGGGSVRITRASVENANATVEAVGAGRSESIGYRIVEDIGLSDRWTEGSITLRVSGGDRGGSAPAPSGSSWARDLTNTLYQAILLRDMDEGGRGFADRIARGDFQTVVQVADEIARSEESRIRLYKNGVSNQQRLVALYENLLDLSSDDIDEEQWSQDLRRLNDGRIAEVVGDMVRSRRFRQVQELDDY
jgi:hypothetical protein